MIANEYRRGGDSILPFYYYLLLDVVFWEIEYSN
jgi:hypothetical protein